MGMYFKGNTNVPEQGSREAFILAHECGCHQEWPVENCVVCLVESLQRKRPLKTLKLAETLLCKLRSHVNYKQLRRYMVDEMIELARDLVNEIGRSR